MTYPVSTRSRLILIRHGQTNGNINRLLNGRTDDRLTEYGQLQAAHMAERVSEEFSIDALVCSPLIRTQQTAGHLSRRIGLDPVLDPAIQEMHFGDLEGFPFERLNDEYPTLAAQAADLEDHTFRWPNGESRTEFHHRSLTSVQAIASAHRDRTVAVVSHGGVISSYLTQIQHAITGTWPTLEPIINCSVSIVTIDGNSFEIECLNDIRHLPEVPVAVETNV